MQSLGEALSCPCAPGDYLNQLSELEFNAGLRSGYVGGKVLTNPFEPP